MNPVARSVLEAVGEVACANALTNPEKTNRAARAQLRENFRMRPQLYGLLRVVVVFCFKLLMGVPWHAFPPEVLLVRRIIKGLLPQDQRKACRFGQFCRRRFIQTPIDPTATLGKTKLTMNEVTLEVSSSWYYTMIFVA